MSELTKALIKFHADVDKIEKNARANYGRFADLANVLSTITPPLVKNGLVITQSFLEDSLVTTLRHTSGETINSTVKLVIQDGRNATQEWGKAVTYQRRYQIVCLLGLVADMDCDASTAEPPVEKPVEKAKPPAKKRVSKKAAPVETAAAELAKATEGEVVQDEQPLSKEEADAVVAVMHDLYKKDNAKFKGIQQAFLKHFQVPEGIMFSQAITTQTHVEFINANL